MMHVRGTHQDCEASVIKANRKHQIVLNMEVKRIETEKKMRERYFCFEMSLVKARRLKIVNRQKALGIYHPHTVDRKEMRKGIEPTSFFFTQSVAMDSKVKLPPVFEKNRSHETGWPTKLTGNSKMLQVSKNNYNNKMIIDKDQAKRIHLRKMGTMERDRGQSQTTSLMKNDSKKLDGRKDDSLGESNELKHIEETNSSRKSSSQDKDEKQLDALILLNKGEGQNEIKESEQKNSHSNASSPVQSDSRENQLIMESATEVANAPNTLNLAPSKQTCIECASSKAQNISNFTTFEELHAWRESLENNCFSPSVDYESLTRAKSATGYGTDVELYNLIVRPQTAFAKLTIE